MSRVWEEDFSDILLGEPIVEQPSSEPFRRPEAQVFAELFSIQTKDYGHTADAALLSLAAQRAPASSPLSRPISPGSVDFVIRTLTASDKAEMGEELFRLAVRACMTRDLGPLARAAMFWEQRATHLLELESSVVDDKPSVVLDEVRLSLQKHFAKIEGIGHVFVAVEGDVVNIWYSIECPNAAVEDRIYDAELNVTDDHPTALIRFSLLFGDIRPEGAIEMHLRASDA